MHELQDTVAAALHGYVGALHELGQAAIRFHQIVTVALRVRRCEAYALQARDGVDGFEQLHEGRFAV